MQKLPENSMQRPTVQKPHFSRLCSAYAGIVWILLLVGTMFLTACGSSSSSTGQIPVTLSGNWQFAVASPADGSFSGGLQGGFLLQQSGSVKGGAAYSVALPPAGTPTVCSSGSAPITGTITSQNVTLTAVAGNQTFVLTGTLSFDGQTMAGTYTSTVPAGSTCGTNQTGLQWSAILVPPMTGSVQGSFHSTGGAAGLKEQGFLVSGGLSQADNAGSSSAAVTGNLNFVNAVTLQTDYPCISTARVSGQISGNTVTLSILGSDGSNIGQIGASAGSGLQIATFDHAVGGYVLHSLGAPAYAVYAAACGGGSLATPADYGNLCLSLNSTAPCALPVTLTPAGLLFPTQLQGTTSMQTITLANASSSTLSNVNLALTNLSNYAETDDCGPVGVPSNLQPFSLSKGQSCVITISFTPQCGAQCPSSIDATLTLNDPANSTIYSVPITGTAFAPQQARFSTPDFGWTDVPKGNHIRLLLTSKRSEQAVPILNSRLGQDVEDHAEIY